MSQQFRRDMRVRRQADFDRVHQGSAYAADEVLVIRACPNEVGMTRLGLSLSRKVGNAVLRNRWKRLMREAFRQNYDRLPGGLDLVIRPRRGSSPQFVPIQESLLRLTERLARRLRKAER
jgi:ribonuclease P protein component